MNESAKQAPSPGAQIRLHDLTKRFGAVGAVDRISLNVPPGAFVSLLGPSGSGKTTTLNLIAGFLRPDAGDIRFDDQSIAEIPPHRRNIGMVFQSYALFPHMTVQDNIGFPLRMRAHLSRAAAQQRVADMVGLMQLQNLEARYPRQLSGGQQQRVAMARALVSHPRVLLMDEPLGALDKKLREQMQIEIRRVHRSVGTTFVYVTHDQAEALTMSDIVVVMHQGRIAQHGTPRELYEAPANAFVADFLGDSSLLAARVVSVGTTGCAVELANGELIAAARGAFTGGVGARAVVLLRPEDMSVTPHRQTADGLGSIAGTLTEISYHGDAYKLIISVGAESMRLRIPTSQAGGLTAGQTVFVSWRADAAKLLPVTEPDSAE